MKRILGTLLLLVIVNFEVFQLSTSLMSLPSDIAVWIGVGAEVTILYASVALFACVVNRIIVERREKNENKVLKFPDSNSSS